MNTTLVWLLMSMPNGNQSYAAQPHAHVVERFADAAECERVAKVLRDTDPGGWTLRLRCVQARIVKEQTK